MLECSGATALLPFFDVLLVLVSDIPLEAGDEIIPPSIELR